MYYYFTTDINYRIEANLIVIGIIALFCIIFKKSKKKRVMDDFHRKCEIPIFFIYDYINVDLKYVHR